MNEKVGLVSFRMDRDAFDKPYSDETARLIDEEVRDMEHCILARCIWRFLMLMSACVGMVSCSSALPCSMQHPRSMPSWTWPTVISVVRYRRNERH